MSVISDYNSLVAAVQNVAEDDGVEFAAYIPVAIDLAEERLFKELDLPNSEWKDIGTLTMGSPYLPKPPNYKVGSFLKITVSGSDILLKKRTEDFIIEYWPNTSITGVPKYYADTIDRTFLIAPTPSANYSYLLKFTPQPIKLTTTYTENYFTQFCVPILYAAVMVEMTKFMKAWDQAKMWEETYTNHRDSWNLNMQRVRRDDGEVPKNPDGGPNSLTHTVNTKS